MLNRKTVFNNSDKIIKSKPIKEDYSIPMTGDNDFVENISADPDPFKTYCLKLLKGRLITYIIASVNIPALGLWMYFSLTGGTSSIWWVILYGLSMLACCVGLYFRSETGRKFFAFPGIILGIPVVIALVMNPSSVPLFLTSSYQLAFQIVSTALLYLLPSVNTFFTASEKGVKRAYNREWEKIPASKQKTSDN